MTQHRTYGVFLTRAAAGLFCLSLISLPASPGRAASAGIALVIGNDLYDGQPQHTACSQTAHDVRNRLRHQGFAVEELVNASSVELRSALDNLAAQLSGAPSGATLIYACLDGAVDGQRLFLMPADADLRTTLQPETQGVVIQALLNALAGTGGAVITDIKLPHGAKLAETEAMLRERLPAGLHLAVESESSVGVGRLGLLLSGGAVPVTAGWDAMASALTPQASAAAGHGSWFLVPAYHAASSAAVSTPAQAPSSPSPLPQTATNTPPAGPPARAAASLPDGLPMPARAAKSSPPEPPPTASPRQSSLPEVSPHPSETGSAPVAVPPAAASPVPRQKLHRPVSIAHASPRTARLQMALTRDGSFGGPIDGVMDERTLSAIRSYQTRHGNPATGVLTQAEIVHLLNPAGASP